MAVIELIFRGKDETGPAVRSATGGIVNATSLVKTAVAGLGVALAGVSIVSIFEKGISAVDTFRQAVVKTAAMITSLQGGDNVAENYRKAKEYAEGLQQTLVQVDARSTMNISGLQQITEEMVKQGVVLDVNNKSQVEAFTRLSNAVAVYSRNGADEIQVRQEVRSLLMGEVDANSQLASMLQKTVDGPLKDQVKQWKESGTLVEEIGKRLSGFGPAADDLAGTWSAMTSSLQTAVDLIMRAGFSLIVDDLVKGMGTVNDFLKENAELIGNRIQQGWLAVKGLVEGVGSFLSTFQGPLALIVELTGMMLRGWGLLLSSVFPPLMSRLGAFGNGLYQTIALLGNLAMSAMSVLSGDFGGANIYVNNAKANFAAMGKAVGETFKGGLLDEIDGRATKFLSLDEVDKSKKTVATPKIDPRADQKTLVAAFRDRAKEIVSIEKDRIKTLLDAETAYLKEMEAKFEAQIKKLDAFNEALSGVRKSQAERDGAAAAASRGPESVLASRARKEQEILKQLSDLSTNFADPAATVKGLDALETSARDFYQAVEDGGATIVSQEQANYDFAAIQEKIRSAIDGQVEAMKEQERQTIDTAQAIVDARDRVTQYKTELEGLDRLLKALPKVVNIDVNLRVNNLAGVQAAMGGGGATISGLGGTSVNTPFGADFFANPANAPAPPIPVGTPHYAAGTDYVPRTGLALIHKGERIIPAAQNQPGALGNVTIAPVFQISGVSPSGAEKTARELAREILPELQKLGKRVA